MMKRFDFLFALALTGLASFVGLQVSSVHHAKSARLLLELTGSAASPDPDPIPTTMSSEGSSAPSSIAPIVISARRGESMHAADRALTRQRLENQAPGTFIGEMLASHDSSLARWPDRRLQPLRIWIQSSASLADWSPAGGSVGRDAFIDWADTGIPLNFTFVLDSLSADVHVTWTDRFAEPISGKTLWSHDERWWILDANIILAVHHRTGEILDADATRAIALHEVGHLIGLDHTADTTSIMTPRVRVKDLSIADRATAQLLYLLPPGPIGGMLADRR